MTDNSQVAPAVTVCVDVGSTWTKAAAVAADGTLVGTSSHVTTPPEVLHGITAAVGALGLGLGLGGGAAVLACSSAGGGLRLAVVGQEPLVSAEAGRRVALSAGARVVHVHAGPLTGHDVRTLRAARPDVVLLVGGTDGGDARTLLHNAARLAATRVAAPIVLAGNAEATADARTLLDATRRTVVVSPNVLPDVGELNPAPAREAIRQVFLRHVIGGKGLSRGPRFRRLVRLVTPDAVLVGVGRLAAVLGREQPETQSETQSDRQSRLQAEPDGRPEPSGRHGGAVLVVDVGGATTDVYSAVSDPDQPQRHVVALPPQRRTVEGDLGMRISAPGVVADAVAERLLPAVPTPEVDALCAAAQRRAADPAWVPGPDDPDGAATDARLAAIATVLAVRRHARMVDGQFGPRGAGLLVLSGGVFRHAAEPALATVVDTLRDDPVLRPLLRHAAIRVDTDYVLAPAGLLADAGHIDAADALASRLTR